MESKKAERQQYLHYFRFWFLAAGILLVIALGKLVMQTFFAEERGNQEAPEERVYDYADVLTDEEENLLREHIASCEERTKIDIVLVTINEYMGESDSAWENAMMVYADDFYDENNYGYDKARGDGVLLLDNWQGGQKGSWLSTCGSVEELFGDYCVSEVLYAVKEQVDVSPYAAYMAYVNETCELMNEGIFPMGLMFLLSLVVTLVAFLYAYFKKKIFKQTEHIGANTYVAGGKPKINHKTDYLTNKRVSSVRINTESSGGGGRSGGGGSHTSSSGTSHGGGGMRR